MESDDPPTPRLSPAVELGTIERNLGTIGFPPRDTRQLLRRSDFGTLRFRSHQICFLDQWSQETLNRKLHLSELAIVFDLSDRAVRRALARGPEDPLPLGRHRALDSETESRIIALVLEAFQRGEPMTDKQLLKAVREQYNPELTKGWIHAFIGRNLETLQECRSFPMEDNRLTVPRDQLEAHIQTMKTLIDGHFSELVFNLDEVGSSEWEDRKPKKIIAPRSVPADQVFHSVARRYRHVTLLACVSAAGDALTPMIISGPVIRDSLWAMGLRQDEDAMVRRRNPAYVSEELFFEYVSDVFIPYVDSLRSQPQFENQPAILLMDSALPHVSERVLRLLGENMIKAVVFPAHTTNIFQALDLVFFSALKKLKETTTGEFDDDSVNEQITKLVHAYEQTATSMNIRGSFRRAGMFPDVGSRPYKIRFDEEQLRKNPGFKEIWDRNLSTDDLSRRRRLHRFGLINAEFLPQ